MNNKTAILICLVLKSKRKRGLSDYQTDKTIWNEKAKTRMTAQTEKMRTIDARIRTCKWNLEKIRNKKPLKLRNCDKKEQIMLFKEFRNIFSETESIFLVSIGKLL